MIYQKKSDEGYAQEHEFSSTAMREHWHAGLEDTRWTFAHRDWLELPPESGGVFVYDVHRDDPT
jgi:NTE family protein